MFIVVIGDALPSEELLPASRQQVVLSDCLLMRETLANSIWRIARRLWAGPEAVADSGVHADMHMTQTYGDTSLPRFLREEPPGAKFLLRPWFRGKSPPQKRRPEAEPKNWVFITGGCSGSGVQWTGVVLHNELVII